MSALLLLRAVTTAGLLAVADALGIEGASDDLVANSGEITYPATTDEHDGVLLQVVADARDVGGDLDLAGQPDAGDLAQRRIGLLRGGRVDARADAPALGTALKRRGVVLGYLVLAALSDQLLDRGHRVSVFHKRAFRHDVFHERAVGTTSSISVPCGATSFSGAMQAPDLRVSLPPRPPWSGVSRSRHSPEGSERQEWERLARVAVRRPRPSGHGARRPLARACPRVTGTMPKSTQRFARRQSEWRSSRRRGKWIPLSPASELKHHSGQPAGSLGYPLTASVNNGGCALDIPYPAAGAGRARAGPALSAARRTPGLRDFRPGVPACPGRAGWGVIRVRRDNHGPAHRGVACD